MVKDHSGTETMRVPGCYNFISFSFHLPARDGLYAPFHMLVHNKIKNTKGLMSMI